MSHTDEIAHRLAEILLLELPEFRYTRSRTQLRKRTEEFSDDLIIDVTTRNGTDYSLSFYLGVAHTETEKLISKIEERKITPYDRTVFLYSVNQQNFELLDFTGDTCWCALKRDTDFSEVSSGIQRFIRECAQSYFQHFHDLLTIRASLEARDGLGQNQAPFKQVLAIDALLGDSDHIRSYLVLLQSELDGGYRHDVQSFNQFYQAISIRFPHLFSSFELK